MGEILAHIKGLILQEDLLDLIMLSAAFLLFGGFGLIVFSLGLLMLFTVLRFATETMRSFIL